MMAIGRAMAEDEESSGPQWLPRKPDCVLRCGIVRPVVSRLSALDIPALAHRAADRLHRLGYTNVAVRVGDGDFGFEDAGRLMGSLSLRLPLTSPHRGGRH